MFYFDVLGILLSESYLRIMYPTIKVITLPGSRKDLSERYKSFNRSEGKKASERSKILLTAHSPTSSRAEDITHIPERHSAMRPKAKRTENGRE